MNRSCESDLRVIENNCLLILTNKLSVLYWRNLVREHNFFALRLST